MKAFLLCALVALVVGAGFFACNPNSIGRPCVNPTGVAPLGTQVSSPALECPSRLCLIHPVTDQTGMTSNMNARSTCTAGCESDDDCNAETQELCKDKNGGTHNYVCAVATIVGPFCCRRVCICPLDLEDNLNKVPDGGVKTPDACDRAKTPDLTCANVAK
jgi:hypothetical protein